ncbi:hypothetical protein BDV26DRAFT_304035 [Aspergillus bertholletiae]|uniref:GST N-terminal domain-containing protein n=1 Tax=Aspergillus bertholletiae TaxID=1226010 RepID=A0A5N7BMX7_9EURO|nr:hypothetical protein BDV26DRAFT_304035 [Aspergillus bertholletiae]
MTATPPPIVLYHYPLSPWAQKVTAYLALRGIEYSECHQPLHWPRPDLTDHFNIQYRRIPVMAIGRDFYYDTTLILEKLETLYPEKKTPLGAKGSVENGLSKLLEKWAETAVMKSTPFALPPDAPLWKDDRFLQDRVELWGDQFGHEARKKQHPGALAEVRLHFGLLEDLLGDGREWILGGDNIKLADIHASCLLSWLATLPGTLSNDFFSEESYPRTHSYLTRYQKAIKCAMDNAPAPTILSAPDAAERILQSNYAEPDGIVMSDPTGFRQGQMVAVSRNDDLSSKIKHRDVGHLVTLTSQEIAIVTRAKTADIDIRIHCPRWQFLAEATEAE